MTDLEHVENCPQTDKLVPNQYESFKIIFFIENNSALSIHPFDQPGSGLGGSSRYNSAADNRRMSGCVCSFSQACADRLQLAAAIKTTETWLFGNL